MLSSNNFVEDANFPDIYLILDSNSDIKGHLLLVPKRHVELFTELHLFEIKQLIIFAQSILNSIKNKNYTKLPTTPFEVWSNIDGFNLEVSDGSAAGQTYPHSHMRIIPRRIGDTG